MVHELEEKKCYNCKKNIEHGIRRFQIKIRNSYGDKEEKVFICSDCYNKRKTKSDLSYKISAIIILILGFITLIISPELSKEVESDVLIFQIGSLFLIIIGFFMFLFRDPNY